MICDDDFGIVFVVLLKNKKLFVGIFFVEFIFIVEVMVFKVF